MVAARHDTCIDENKVGIVDNSLRNRGEYHQKAIIMSVTVELSWTRAEDTQDWKDDGEKND